ncbi:MAG: hypothetical protein HY238_06430 [Acidobacteria bacterium]|nr:hypothetical protein [Acidobacteriota bacterium]
MILVLGCLVVTAALAGTVPDEKQVLRGRIHQEAGKPPVIQTAGQKNYTISGDKFTEAQMADPKLNGREIELDGYIAAPGRFDALKIFTIKDGKRYTVTYWCDICSIRTHMPGRCMCCQGETELQELPAP